MAKPILFWFRRDLRIRDNAGLYHALRSGSPVLCCFVFDSTILKNLPPGDRRVDFIFQTVKSLKQDIENAGGELRVLIGDPTLEVPQLAEEIGASAVYANNDYEPAAKLRDQKVSSILEKKSILFNAFKDHILFEENEVVKDDGKPYVVFTAYKNKVLQRLKDPFYTKSYPTLKYLKGLVRTQVSSALPTLGDLGFLDTGFVFPKKSINKNTLLNYQKDRDFPALENGTSHLGLHLRFGTVSVRELAILGLRYSDVWLSELIWRDFFAQILFHFPYVEKSCFKPEYDQIRWRDSKHDLKAWQEGQTGYPLVDAGMRELNATGYMHNRVRMVTASFLCKHLLIDWREGEKYFAEKLLDYDLSSNNGNWQWVAGCGVDAAPYFRVFNPVAQAEKFDPENIYIKKWIPEFGTNSYAKPIVDHAEARHRCLRAYAIALQK